jgi:hypothetical protein
MEKKLSYLSQKYDADEKLIINCIKLTSKRLSTSETEVVNILMAEKITQEQQDFSLSFAIEPEVSKNLIAFGTNKKDLTALKKDPITKDEFTTYSMWFYMTEPDILVFKDISNKLNIPEHKLRYINKNQKSLDLEWPDVYVNVRKKMFLMQRILHPK